ncbi:hypothetical protein VKS41_005984 [Umbelopsis sp. WA50703]
MDKEKWAQEELESDDDSENDLDYQPDPEDDNESDNDNASVVSEEEDGENLASKKRKRSPTENKPSSDSAPHLDDSERERKKRIDAIWAEMNSTTSSDKASKQPLDDISSSMNRSSKVNEDIKDPKVSSSIATPPSSETSSPPEEATTLKRASAAKPAIARPKSNLSALVSQYNIKTPKMNTLDKSKLDWQGYVDREGIREDLKYRNKDGYMEKVAFLQRVDDRRLQDLKAGQRSAPKKR